MHQEKRCSVVSVQVGRRVWMTADEAAAGLQEAGWWLCCVTREVPPLLLVALSKGQTYAA